MPSTTIVEKKWLKFWPVQQSFCEQPWLGLLGQLNTLVKFVQHGTNALHDVPYHVKKSPKSHYEMVNCYIAKFYWLIVDFYSYIIRWYLSSSYCARNDFLLQKKTKIYRRLFVLNDVHIESNIYFKSRYLLLPKQKTLIKFWLNFCFRCSFEKAR